MKKQILILIIGLFALQSCNKKTSNSIYWVSGYKTTCQMWTGAESECLYVHKGDDVDHGEWKYFNDQIQGFEYKEGVLQKVEVKEEKLDPQTVPQDASNIKYSVVKVLETINDTRLMLDGNWTAVKVNGQKINRMVKAPVLQIDVRDRQLTGNDGCNTFNAKISALSLEKISINQPAVTSKMCNDMETSTAFQKALASITEFIIDGDKLELLNANGNEVLEFISGGELTSNESTLNDGEIWYAFEIDGNQITDNAMAPTISFDISGKQVKGNDGCNNYKGSIKDVANTSMVFGPLAGTKKMCPDMSVSKAYNTALANVERYAINDTKDGKVLVLADPNEKALVKFKLKPAVETTTDPVDGDWMAVRIGGGPISRMVTAPTMNINVEKGLISGNNSCNNFTVDIITLNEDEIQFGPMVGTLKECMNKNVQKDFMNALGAAQKFVIEKNTITFYDGLNDEVLAFIRK